MSRTLTASLALLALAGLAGCGATGGGAPGSRTEVPLNATASPETAPGTDLSAEAVLAANADATTVRDDEWSAASAVNIELSGATATSPSTDVTVEGGTVTVRAAGVYRLTGVLDGPVVVAAPDDAQVVLILNGVHIANPAGPAISVTGADDVAISLAEGSRNEVSDAAVESRPSLCSLTLSTLYRSAPLPAAYKVAALPSGPVAAISPTRQ